MAGDVSTADSPDQHLDTYRRNVVRRGPFSRASASSAAALPTTALFATNVHAADSKLSKGDAAILRFLAAAEIIESDLWQAVQRARRLPICDGQQIVYAAAAIPKIGEQGLHVDPKLLVGRSAAVQTEGLGAMRGAANTSQERNDDLVAQREHG